jgi:hypothetical protein
MLAGDFPFHQYPAIPFYSGSLYNSNFSGFLQENYFKKASVPKKIPLIVQILRFCNLTVHQAPCIIDVLVV